jgi:Ice-binding-like
VGAITGFDPLVLSTQGTYGTAYSYTFLNKNILIKHTRISRFEPIATSSQVAGMVFSSSYNAPTPGDLTTAVTAMQAAYTNAMGQTPVDFSEFQGGALGGSVLIPGIYKFSTAVNIATDLTLTGTCNDVYVFQIAYVFFSLWELFVYDYYYYYF